MAWLEVHQSVRDHRKVLQAADDLGIAPAAMIGHMVLTWLWALDNAPDGVIAARPGIVARAAQWAGDPSDLITALCSANLLEASADGESLVIHDWSDYAGRLIDRRRADVERKRTARGQSEGRPQDIPRKSAATVQHPVPSVLTQHTQHPPEGAASAAHLPTTLKGWMSRMAELSKRNDQVGCLVDLVTQHSSSSVLPNAGGRAAALLKATSDPLYATTEIWKAVTGGVEGDAIKYALGVLKNGHGNGRTPTRRPHAEPSAGGRRAPRRKIV